MAEALAGIRVLDLSRFRAGPTCGQILGDMGAEVVRVERPGGEDDRRIGPFVLNGERCYLMFTCRNKKGITLNLQKPQSRAIVSDLVRRSDIVIENFGPDVNKRLGLDYESLKKIRPDIIDVAVSGYGQTGPYASRLGFDGVAQAMSGLMWVTGFPEGRPVKSGVSFIDTSTGIYGALGAMFALFHRQRTGEGQLVDVGLLDVAVSFTETIVAEYEVAHEIHPQVGNGHIYVGPFDAHQAKDGWFYVASTGNFVWRRFCKVLGREDLLTDPKLATDSDRSNPAGRKFFAELLGRWAADKTVAEVVKIFNDGGVPCGPVNTVPQVAADPHIRAREMLVEVDHEGTNVPLVGMPFKCSVTPARIKRTSPKVGEHNKEIYCGLLGYTGEQLAKLKEEGVV